jgi:TolA-binding protein
VSPRLAICALALLLAMPLAAGEAVAKPWRWELADQRYKALNAFERAQYDKGAKLYRTGDHRAAASEFEKYKVQFGDTAAPEMLAYANLMQGLALLAAKDRNAAIRTFTEVLDYFADDVEDAGAAMYFKGRAQLDGGDTRKGLETFQKMAEHEEYRYHALAAGAIRELADNLAKTNQEPRAIELYRQVALDFATANPEEARNARWNLAAQAMRDRKIDSHFTWLAEHAPGEADNPQWRVRVLDEIRQPAFHMFHGDGRGMPDKQQRNEAQADFAAWYLKQRPWYEKANNLWAYFDHMFSIFCNVGGWSRDSLGQLTDQCLAFCKAGWEAAKNNEGARNGNLEQWSWLVDRLSQLGQHERALAVAELIPWSPVAGIKTFVVQMNAGKRDGIVDRLEAVEKDPAAGPWAKRATELKAHFYNYRIGDMEKAIKAYRDLDNPPGNLWQIQDCFRRWGKTKECFATLDEIEGSFPGDAARAAWQKIECLRQDGDKKAAIRNAIRLLKMYKQSGEAGRAVDFLESEGVQKTGGGDFQETP